MLSNSHKQSIKGGEPLQLMGRTVITFGYVLKEGVPSHNATLRFGSVHVHADSWVDMEEFRKACRTPISAHRFGRVV